MVKPILYSADFSPAARAVWLTAAAIGLDLDSRPVNLMAGEHLKPEYIKLNPQHTVPTLDDNGKIIWDSHAISTYLIEKYAKDDSLYPKDLYIRARIHQRLHFDTGVIFQKGRSSSEAVFYRGATEFPQEGIDEIQSSYDFMELFLKNDSYLVGNHLTVADLCCAATISTVKIAAPIDPGKYPKLYDWFERIRTLPYYESANGRRVDAFKEFLYGKLAANKVTAEKNYK